MLEWIPRIHGDQVRANLRHAPMPTAVSHFGLGGISTRSLLRISWLYGRGVPEGCLHLFLVFRWTNGTIFGGLGKKMSPCSHDPIGRHQQKSSTISFHLAELGSTPLIHLFVNYSSIAEFLSSVVSPPLNGEPSAIPYSSSWVTAQLIPEASVLQTPMRNWTCGGHKAMASAPVYVAAARAWSCHMPFSLLQLSPSHR